MKKRSADATIKGYYYQLDTSILKLLDLQGDSESITIEGIEDIDINTATEDTTIQCKYLSKPKFIYSSVREPIILMLDHFSNTIKSTNYILYAHFENEISGNEPPIDLTKLKEILTYSENRIEKHYEIEQKISDDTLNAFLLQFKLIFGVEFYTQQQQVISKLKNKFNCSEFEADTLYYNNALRVVIDKAIQKNAIQRIITKAEFINNINCSKKLFSEWFINLRSKKEYLKSVVQNLKSTLALSPSRTKIILLGKNILDADNTELTLLSFVENLISKYYKPSSSLRNAKPLTIIFDCDKPKLLEIKRSFIENGIVFNDGYEEIRFSEEIFNKEPIVNTTKSGTKILKTSYSLKIISKLTFESNFENVTPPNVFMIFSKEDISIRFDSGQLFEIKYCDNLKEVHKLLIPQ